MGDIIINQQRNDGYSHQNRSSFACFLSLYKCVYVDLSACVFFFFFCYISHLDIYIVLLNVYCVWLALCVHVCSRVCSLSLFIVCENPFFVERYDTLLMLHFRFATTMTASIWLCLATNTHTIQSITFPSHFFAVPCAFFTVGPEYFVSFAFSDIYRDREQVRGRESARERKKERIGGLPLFATSV